MNAFEYMRVSSSQAAVTAKAKYGNSQFLAGGTNLVDLMKRGVTSPDRLIDINALPLAKVEEKSTGLRVGAMVRNSDLSEHPLVLKHFPLLSQALKSGASPQLRNMATVGGNMMQRTRCPYFYDVSMPCNKRKPGSGCGAIGGYNRMHAIFGASDKCIAVHPSDMCVALAALDAKLTIAGARGERVLNFTDFHRLPGEDPARDNTLQPGELIVSVEIPFNKYAHSYYLKLRDRASYAFALVSVAAALQVENGTVRGARLAMGGVAHKPWRLTDAERALVGQPATVASFQKAAELAMKDAKGYGGNNFKLRLAPNAVVEALSLANVKA